MNKVKAISIFFLVFLIILGVYIYLGLQQNSNPPNNEPPESTAKKILKPPIEKTEKHVAEYNDWIQQSQREREKIDTSSKEYKEKEKSHYSRLIELSKFEIHDIEFHGRIIDQHGAPVAGVQIHYIGNRSVLAAGSGEGRLFSDENGAFVIKAKGKALVIHEMKKTGYELPERQRFSNSGGHQTDLSWRSFNSTNPYIFNAWKVESYPKIKKNNHFLGFMPDNRDYTINFLLTGGIKNEGVTDGDLRMRIKRDEENWQLEIAAVNGGLQETSDEYLNLAPESGYTNTLIFSGHRNRGRPLFKNVYFVSRSNQFFGRIKMEIRPFHNKKESAIEFDYAINLESGRNLTVKKE